MDRVHVRLAGRARAHDESGARGMIVYPQTRFEAVAVDWAIRVVPSVCIGAILLLAAASCL